MKKNIILLIMFIMVLTGCSSEYTLEYSNKGIKENINVEILNSEIPAEEVDPITEPDDQVTPFINNDQYPFFRDDTKKYEKQVTRENGVTKVNLSYEYTLDNYTDSRIYNSCFENYSFTKGRKNAIFSFDGAFYCLYGNEIAINIKTNNLVTKHNADKVSGNVYTWIINKDNVSNTNINIVISKWPAFVKPVIYIIIGIVVILLCVFGYKAYKKILNRDKVNEI